MDAVDPDWILPEWPAPVRVQALITTRQGGVSEGRYGNATGERGGLNLGYGSGDSFTAVSANRALLQSALPAEPRWLKQVHGATVVDAATVGEPVAADASYTDRPGVVAVCLVADCMPVLLADAEGRCVGVAHAGWRGLAAGVIQATAQAMRKRLREPASLMAYLGPAIGPSHFEVGPEVLAAMQLHLPDAAAAFKASTEDKYLADLFALGRMALAAAGIHDVFGGGQCTFSEPRRYYSHRRDRVTGRHAALIWLVPD